MKTDDCKDTKRMWETHGEMLLPACLPQSPLTVLPAEVSRRFLSPVVLLAMSGVIGWNWAELGGSVDGTGKSWKLSISHCQSHTWNNRCWQQVLPCQIEPKGPDCPQQGAKVDRQETKPVSPTLKG